MILRVPACSACKQTCLYMFTHCHIINPSLIPHWCTTPSLYDCARCLPNPSPTPVQVQIKLCPTHASAKGPMQTNQRPKEPSARQSKQTMTMMTRTSQATNKKQWMGWRTRMIPQHWEAVDEGVPWKKAPLEGTLGTIIVDCALISFFFFFFFFFVFMITYCFFTKYLLFINRKTAHIRAHDDVELSPQRYAGHDHSNHALYLFFFFEYLLFINRKTAHVQAHNDVELSPQRYAGMIVTIVPFFLFWILTVFLQENNPWSGLWWHGTVPTKVCWARSLWSCPFSFFLYLFFWTLGCDTGEGNVNVM